MLRSEVPIKCMYNISTQNGVHPLFRPPLRERGGFVFWRGFRMLWMGIQMPRGDGVLGDDFTAAEAVCIRSARVADAVERYVQ